VYLDFAAGVDTPKLEEEAETHCRDALTLDEARAVLKTFNGKRDVKSMRDALIMRIMLNCGLRSIEIVRLDATDIEKRRGKIYLLVWGKGRKGKTSRVEISKTIYNMIQDYLNARGSKRMKGEPMFTSTARRNFGQRLQTQSISRLAKRTLRAVGVDSESITCHSCRHFFASELLNQGVEISTIQRLMRHKNQSVTEVYIHDKKRAADTSVLMLSKLLDVA
jgi:integrase/recombinase XerD